MAADAGVRRGQGDKGNKVTRTRILGVCGQAVKTHTHIQLVGDAGISHHHHHHNTNTPRAYTLLLAVFLFL